MYILAVTEIGVLDVVYKRLIIVIKQISRGNVADYAGCFTTVCGVSCLTVWHAGGHCSSSCSSSSFRSTCSGTDCTAVICYQCR